jgi:hypothetical protein
MPARLCFQCFSQRIALRVLLASLICIGSAWAQSAFVRVSQVGYEAGGTPHRAYLMSIAPAGNAKFEVLNSKGEVVHSGHVGALLGS